MEIIYENLRDSLGRFKRQSQKNGKVIKHVLVSREEFDILQIECPEIPLEPYDDADNEIDGVKIKLQGAPSRTGRGNQGAGLL